MVGDVDALHVILELVEIVAVVLIEFDALGDVVEVSADHVVVADDFVPVGEESIREMAAQKPGYARNEDTLFRQDDRSSPSLWIFQALRPSGALRWCQRLAAPRA